MDKKEIIHRIKWSIVNEFRYRFKVYPYVMGHSISVKDLKANFKLISSEKEIKKYKFSDLFKIALFELSQERIIIFLGTHSILMSDYGYEQYIEPDKMYERKT